MDTLSVPMHTRSSSQSSVQTAAGENDPPKVTKRRVWTAQEDAALREAIQLFGSRTGPGSAWPAISKHVSVHGGRSNKDCRKRWFHTLDPGLKKGKWTQAEDEALRKAFAEVGASWSEMALRVPGRTDEQVAKRWRDVLSPDLNLPAPWQPEEDALLLRLFKELGPKWTLMSDSFATRNGIACRNRFRSLRKIMDQANPGVSPLSEAPSTSSALTTSSENPFFATENHDMSFLDNLLNNQSQFPSITFDQPQELFPDAEDAQDQSWFDTFFQTHTTDTFNQEKAGDDAFVPPWPDPSTSSDWFATHSFDNSAAHPPPTAVSDASATSGSTSETPAPIGNVWGLLVALESGKESMLVSAPLIRQLMADAAKKDA